MNIAQLRQKAVYGLVEIPLFNLDERQQVARKVQTVESFADDVDGSAAAETVAFGIDGVSYEIDLSRRNAKAIRSDFDKWVKSARKAPRTRARRAARVATPAVSGDSAAIRSWAAKKGIAVNARGRIPAAIIEQYRAS
jgi:hypothetical protein